LLEIAKTEAENNLGIPVVFACCEVVREWLVDNNVKGQDDGSMYAQMIRKAKEAEKEKVRAVIDHFLSHETFLSNICNF